MAKKNVILSNGTDDLYPIASKLGESTVGASNQLVYLVNGVATAGVTFHCEDHEPAPEEWSNGDFWFIVED